MSSLRWFPNQRLSQINRESNTRHAADSKWQPRKGKTQREHRSGNKANYLQNRIARAQDNRDRNRRIK